MLKGWTAFHNAHAQPYMLFGDLLEARRRQSRFALLGSLAEALELKGDYALLPERDVILMAFECEDDTRRFSESLLARPTVREGGRAGQWAFIFDEVMEERIKAVLPPRPKRRPTKAA